MDVKMDKGHGFAVGQGHRMDNNNP
jgi:hypothetical protein